MEPGAAAPLARWLPAEAFGAEAAPAAPRPAGRRWEAEALEVEPLGAAALLSESEADCVQARRK